MPSASSWIAARTMSSTLRLWPRCMTSAPCACSRRRMMLIAASWPSNSEAALTKRSGPRQRLLSPVGSAVTACVRCFGHRASPPAAASAGDLNLLLSRILPGSMILAPPGVNRCRRMTADLPVPPPGDDDPAVAWRGRRRRRDHGHKRDAVIRTAARAFDERGYHNTSLDDIAAALGVTKPTIYYYVPNKEQLLFECFRAGLEPIRAALRRAEQSPGTGRDRLREVIRDYALAIASEYGWCMVRAEHQDLGAELSAPGAGAQGRDRPRHPAPAAGRNRRRFDRRADPKLAAFAIAGALNWIAHWYRAGRTLSAGRRRRGLRAVPRARPGATRAAAPAQPAGQRRQRALRRS